MDQCKGQLDVFEIIADIEKRGIIPVSGNGQIVVMSGNFEEFAKLSIRPLWNRGSSPQ
jgi:hypothetical protein